MTSNTCLTVVDACIIRVAALTTAGAPSTGALQGYVSDAQIKVTIGLELEKGAEFIQKNGCGQIIARVKELDKIKGATLSLDLGKLDRELLYLMCGGRLMTTSGVVTGYEPNGLTSADPAPFCFEVYSKAWDGSAHAVTAATSPNVAYDCFVLPFVRGVQQPFTLANGITVFTVNGDASENANLTANGPWNDWPAAVSPGITKVYGEFLTATLPTAACGRVSVPTGS